MMFHSAISASRGWLDGYREAWDSFWFTPRLPHTLAFLRVVTGVMMLYSHLVLASDLESFLGEHAWIDNQTARGLHAGAFGFSDLGRSYLWHLSSPVWLWLHHVLTLIVTASFAAGLLTRITAPAAWFLQLMYLHRMTGMLFGFDQIITYSAMYLMLSPCGSCYSVDAWLRERYSEQRAASGWLRWFWPAASASVAANVATRLFQFHLCVIYLFGGLSKARGQTWWDGTAMWYSVGNYEYQSIDMTWIAPYPLLFSAITHATLFWEVFYCVLVWPARTRPLVLAAAVVVHGGIALFLGMLTFGSMMVAANMIFVRPETMRRWIARIPGLRGAETQADESETLAAADGDDAAGGSDETGGDEMEFDVLSLEGLGLDELDLGSHGSDILGRGADPQASQSGILTDLVQREARIVRREERIRLASRTLQDKQRRLRQQLEKYNQRVAKLKEREAKIKRLVERRRSGKSPDEGD
jgi:hypothetical protein